MIVWEVTIGNHQLIERCLFGIQDWLGTLGQKMVCKYSLYFLILFYSFSFIKADTEILCGTHLWNGDDQFDTPHDIKRPTCTRICKFRKDTILKLQYHGPTAGSYSYLINE